MEKDIYFARRIGCNPEVCERSFSSTNGFDLSNGSAGLLCFGVALFVGKGIANPIKVFPEHLCNLDYVLHGRSVYTGA